MKVSNPYFNKAEGRMCINVPRGDGTKRQMYYSRFLIEREYGPIGTGMVVHHIDGDQLNDRLDNLAVLTVAQHNKIHNAKATACFVCPICGEPFSLSGKLLKYAKARIKRGSKGPYCSMKCALVYRSAINGRWVREVSDD